MNIGLDVMGGDLAPEKTMIGAIMAQKELGQGEKIVLIGNQNDITTICKREHVDPSLFDIVHADDVITMGDNPVKAFSQKTSSSMHIGYQLLNKGKIDGFASAGNTGAMLIGAMYTVKSIPGIIRPAIAASVPQEKGHPKILLDIGINPDCKPDVLYQYAIIGSIYASAIYNIDYPKVALLNIGEEEEKGDLLTKSTHQMMKDSRDFNFVGNIEGNELFVEEKADVIVCDGFVGNVVLKSCEAFYSMMRRRKIKDDFFERFNFENIGGTPVLGINNVVIIGHGISNETAIKNMILQTKHTIEVNLIDKFRKKFDV